MLVYQRVYSSMIFPATNIYNSFSSGISQLAMFDETKG